MCAIPERLRGVFKTRRYRSTFTIPYKLSLSVNISLSYNFIFREFNVYRHLKFIDVVFRKFYDNLNCVALLLLYTAA